MYSYEKEQRRLQNFMDEVLTEMENEGATYDDESDDEEEDFEELLNHESESEQELSDTNEDEACESSSLSFIGKTG